MWWSILLLLAIAFLALGIKKATRGTPFEHRCPCTPYIEHLRWVENPDSKAKRENLW